MRLQAITGVVAIVGMATFALERKLPYRRMLIATGVLIGVVLAIMTRVTVHNLQGLGWIGTTPVGINLSLACGRWLGLYANWEGIGAQIAGHARRLRLLRRGAGPPGPPAPSGDEAIYRA